MNARKCSSRSFMTCLVPADQLSVARLVLVLPRAHGHGILANMKVPSSVEGTGQQILRLCILLIWGHSIDGTSSGLWRVQVTMHSGLVGPTMLECPNLCR